MSQETPSSSSPFLLIGETPFRTKIKQRLDIFSTYVHTQSLLPSTLYCVWVMVIPATSRVAADGAYNATVPVVLGAVRSSASGDEGEEKTLLSAPRWSVQAGSHLYVHVEAATASPESVLEAMLGAVRRVDGGGHEPARRAPLSVDGQSPRSSPSPVPSPAADLASQQIYVELRGTQTTETRMDGEGEWMPLVVRRWFELRDPSAEEATFVYKPPSVPQVEGRPIVDGVEADAYYCLSRGEAKEAQAIDISNTYIKWTDNSISLAKEVIPYRRTFTPARPEKTVRVRRFPHRYANVIGELPFGTSVMAVGKQCDLFTGEEYVLLLLPTGPAWSWLPTHFDLPCVEGEQFLWGWSKVAGSSGGPFLQEVAGGARGTDAHASSFPARGMCVKRVNGRTVPMYSCALPPGSFFVSARNGKHVRIRRHASLRSEAIGELEPNEIKEAVAALEVRSGDHNGASPPDAEAAPSRSYFVAWKSGGFSIRANEHQTFLEPVALRETAQPSEDETASPSRKRDRQECP